MNEVVYDAGVLAAADRNERVVWAKHTTRVAMSIVPLVPAPVVAQPGGCRIVPIDEAEAHEAGRLLGISKTTDVVDAVVVTTALRHNAVILTGDPEDMARLISAAGRDLGVAAV